jgi:hypothetical protein
MLRLIKYLVILLVLLALALPVGLLVAGLQREPLVPLDRKPTADDVARAKALMTKYDPRVQGGGGARSLEIPERDLSLLLDYGVGQLLHAGAAVDLHRAGADVSLTVPVPENPFGRFFNLQLELSQAPDGIDVEGMRVGTLPVPRVVARAAGQLAHRALRHDGTYRAVVASVNGYRITEDRLVVVYQWQPELLNQVKSRGSALLIDDRDRERLLAYSARIATAARQAQGSRAMPLPDLLGPLFREAQARTGANGDAAAENRAALIAAMLHVQGADVARLLDATAEQRQRGRVRTLTLLGRRDLAQHFLISAGIAAAGGGGLANAVGLFKELDDSRSGSGFSFTDLAADRAGVRLAETATGAGAARLQSLLADRPAESLFMPAVKDLPEFMPEKEFVRRFGGVDDPRYRQVADDIERRIAALEIHRASR